MWTSNTLQFTEYLQWQFETIWNGYLIYFSRECQILGFFDFININVKQ